MAGALFSLQIDAVQHPTFVPICADLWADVERKLLRKICLSSSSTSLSLSLSLLSRFSDFYTGLRSVAVVSQGRFARNGIKR